MAEANLRQLRSAPPELNRQIQDGLLSFVVDNWKPVNPYDLSDPAEDLMLTPGDQVSL